MAVGIDLELEDRTPNKTLVDQGLALLLPSFANAVARVLEKSFGDRWWSEVQGLKAPGSGPAGGRVLRFLDEPPSDSFEDRVGVLQITHCCEIVFAYRKEFTNAWGREHIGASNLVLEARHKTSHRTAAGTDLSADDAEYYLYAMVKMARVIKADRGTVDILERLHDVLWRGGTLGYLPVSYECAGDEPSVSDVSAPEGRGALAAPGYAGRWSDDDGLRARVLAEMDGMDPGLVEREICERILSEVDSMETSMRSTVCVFPSPPGEVPDIPELTIVVLPPADGAVTGASCRAAEAQADEAMASSEGRPRVYRNMLVFVFPETVPYRLLERSASEYLALRSVAKSGQDFPGLSRHLREADLDVGRRLRAAYSGVLAPEGPWDRYGHCYRRLRPADGNIIDGALFSLVREGLLYVRGEGDGAGPFRPTMTALGWPGSLPGGSARISDYWEAASSQCGMPRFESKDVFLQAIWRDVRDGRYGYAPPGPDGGPSGEVRIGEELASISMDGFVVNCDGASNGWILLEGGGRETRRLAPRAGSEGGGPGERGPLRAGRPPGGVAEHGRRARGVGRNRGADGRRGALGPPGVRGPRG